MTGVYTIRWDGQIIIIIIIINDNYTTRNNTNYTRANRTKPRLGKKQHYGYFKRVINGISIEKTKLRKENLKKLNLF